MSFRSGLTLIAPTRLHFHCGYKNSFRWIPPAQTRYISTEETPQRYTDLIVRRLYASVKRNDVTEVHQYYRALVEDVRRAKALSTAPTPSLLDRDQLRQIIDILGASGRAFDLALIENILVDMPEIFNIERTQDVQTAIIRALIKGGNLQSIHRWLMTMSQKPGNMYPTLDQWHLFLEYCYESNALGTIQAVVKTMRACGCPPTNSTFKIVIRALFNLSPTVPGVSSFSAIMDEIQQEGRKYDPTIGSMLYDGYIQTNNSQLAVQVERLYRSRFPEALQEEWMQAAWNKTLGEEAQRLGVRAAVKLCRKFKPEGFVASSYTLSAILRNSKSVKELQHVSGKLGVRATIIHWSMLIRNAVRAGDVPTALSTYAESKKFGILPGSAMLHPIISSLCQPAFKPPAEPAIDQALDLYRDLALASDQKPLQETNTENITPSDSRHASGPDATVYNTILRALASSDNITKYHPIAMTLLDEMQARNIRIDDSMTMTSTTIILMRKASNHMEAFDIYRRLCQGKGVLDVKGYGVVLNAFCKLSFRDQPTVPSPQFYFEMVKDMRDAGIGMTVEIYTIILRQLALLATQMTSDQTLTEDFRDDLLVVIRRVHDHLTVDASITPDTIILNQLMDTYQRAGFFSEAYKVWDMIYLSGRFDNISVSIIIDACGYAGKWEVASQICRKLFDDGFWFNLHNWNGWVECLCRLGKLDEAVMMVCLSPKTGRSITPDEDSVRILFKFAKKTNRLGDVQARIKQYLPDLYRSLPRLPEDLREW